MTDSRNQEVLQKCVNESGLKLDPVIVFPMENEQPFIDILLNMEGRHHQKIDCLVSIERLGAASDGQYYNMRYVLSDPIKMMNNNSDHVIYRGMNISEYTAKIDKLFLTAQLYPELGIKTIGIGDGECTENSGDIYMNIILTTICAGGNEIGMVRRRPRSISSDRSIYSFRARCTRPSNCSSRTATRSARSSRLII